MSIKASNGQAPKTQTYFSPQFHLNLTPGTSIHTMRSLHRVVVTNNISYEVTKRCFKSFDRKANVKGNGCMIMSNILYSSKEGRSFMKQDSDACCNRVKAEVGYTPSFDVANFVVIYD